MKVAVKILPRKEVLDTQGRAVENTLRNSGKKLNTVQVGRYVILDLPETDEAKAMTMAREMTEHVLYNPLIESYELEKM